MSQASNKVQQILSVALQRIQKSPDLTPADADRVRQFAIRMIAEFSVAKAGEANEPKAGLSPSQHLTNSSSKVQEVLSVAMEKVQKSPDLTSQDAEWVRQFAIHLIAELSVIKAENAMDQKPLDPLRITRKPNPASGHFPDAKGKAGPLASEPH